MTDEQREKLREKVRGIVEEVESSCGSFDVATDAILAAVEQAQPHASVTEWVSTDDRKPELRQRVLAIDAVASDRIEIDWQTTGPVFGARYWASGVYRTHWQPLPQPPEEDA